ncbi:hypothetical protein L873DRAFT_973093 [Choiromyces venosus 120613-1]|uniref:Uncharacterized protein n=1 Tax=Choiromyces venosus 120613-1 TaxID=1336337 RepID=A0A3N4JPC9_9PEZI|nr:hypothetical protein L873DRAFT_973093 [Choiromyces venosus 120613-1]
MKRPNTGGGGPRPPLAHPHPPPPPPPPPPPLIPLLLHLCIPPPGMPPCVRPLHARDLLYTSIHDLPLYIPNLTKKKEKRKKKKKKHNTIQYVIS